jgi:gluconolactonase
MKNNKMMYLETPPRLIETKIFSAVPAEFRRKVRTDWADANRPGAPTDCFIEGPSFDADGNLYIVDIPFGRIFRISPDKKWSLVVEYEGWPNGLKIDAKGRILVADYMHGIMELDARVGKMLPVLTARNSESFKGCNDLHIASNGDIYFTDQGQTGLHDPTGRVYRLTTGGRLDCLINTGISPNGLVLDPTESVLFVAMTPRQFGLARAVHEGRQRFQGRAVLLDLRSQWPRRHDHGPGRPVVRGACLA